MTLRSNLFDEMAAAAQSSFTYDELAIMYEGTGIKDAIGTPYFTIQKWEKDGCTFARICNSIQGYHTSFTFASALLWPTKKDPRYIAMYLDKDGNKRYKLKQVKDLANPVEPWQDAESYRLQVKKMLVEWEKRKPTSRQIWKNRADNYFYRSLLNSKKSN